MTVIGPIDRKMWNTLRLLKGSIEWDKKHPDPKMSASTDWMVGEYKELISSLLDPSKAA